MKKLETLEELYAWLEATPHHQIEAVHSKSKYEPMNSSGMPKVIAIVVTGHGNQKVRIPQEVWAQADLIYGGLFDSRLYRPRSADTAPRQHRHVKRGTTYVNVGTAELQTSSVPLVDGSEMRVYRDEQTGKMWVRETSEFADGRFEELK